MGVLRECERVLAGLGYSVDVMAMLAFFALAMARLLSAILLAPFLGGPSVPGQIKIGLAAILAAVLYPGIATPDPAPANAVVFVALLVKEVMIGAAIGLAAQLVFFAVQMAGTVIDTQRGMNQISFFVPQLTGHTSVLGSFQFQASLVVFLAMDGHLLFLRALDSSFQSLPVARFPKFAAGGLGMAEQMARISADTFLIALELSAPVLVALFLVDLSFGAIGKVASQVQAHAESQPVKALVGLGVLLLSAGFVLDRLQFHLAGMMRALQKLIGGFA